MPYITIPVRQKEYQISFDDILNGINESFFARMMDDTCDTRTVCQPFIGQNQPHPAAVLQVQESCTKTIAPEIAAVH